MLRFSHRRRALRTERASGNRKIQWEKTTFSPGRGAETPRSRVLKVRGRRRRPPICLLRIQEMPTAVLLPASFIALAAEGLFLAVADRLDAAGIDARCRQCILDSAGTLVAQSQVVIRRSAFVAMPFNREVHARMLIEELGIGLNRGLLVATNIGLVVIEVDVLNILSEQILIRDGRSRWRRWRGCLRDGQSCSRLLRSTRTFRG